MAEYLDECPECDSTEVVDYAGVFMCQTCGADWDPPTKEEK